LPELIARDKVEKEKKRLFSCHRRALRWRFSEPHAHLARYLVGVVPVSFLNVAIKAEALE